MTFDINYDLASMKADPMQRLQINFMATVMKQNEEILKELKKLNSSK